MMNMTLVEAQGFVQQQAHAGILCPCCGQMAKVYRRTITSGAARGLILAHEKHRLGWFHVTDSLRLVRLGGEFARLRYWGLIEEQKAPREDGGRAGYWRLTTRGADFVANKLTVPKYAAIYNGDLLYLDDSQHINIEQALGKAFDYRELMTR